MGERERDFITSSLLACLPLPRIPILFLCFKGDTLGSEWRHSTADGAVRWEVRRHDIQMECRAGLENGP